MSNHTDLSAHTRIEEMDGRLYLVTKLRVVAVAWEGRDVEVAVRMNKFVPLQGTLHSKNGVETRILLTAVAPVYEYREGEPWVSVNEGSVSSVILWAGSWPRIAGWPVSFHRRAAIVCDTAEQFRTLYEELKEARDG